MTADELSAKYAKLYEELEARWIDKHREARRMIDALGISAPTDGLYAFLTRGLDESFEREVAKLYKQFDEEAGA